MPCPYQYPASTKLSLAKKKIKQLMFVVCRYVTTNAKIKPTPRVKLFLQNTQNTWTQFEQKVLRDASFVSFSNQAKGEQ